MCLYTPKSWLQRANSSEKLKVFLFRFLTLLQLPAAHRYVFTLTSPGLCCPWLRDPWCLRNLEVFLYIFFSLTVARASISAKLKERRFLSPCWLEMHAFSNVTSKLHHLPKTKLLQRTLSRRAWSLRNSSPCYVEDLLTQYKNTMLYQTGVYFIIPLKARGRFVFRSPCEMQTTLLNTCYFKKRIPWGDNVKQFALKTS